MERSEANRIQRALDVAVQYGQFDGSHHKAWAIDQMVRALTGSSTVGDPTRIDSEEYTQLIADAKDGEDGPDSYEWDEGIPP